MLGKLVWWGPRITGMLIAGFFAIFALDAFNNTSFFDALPAFGIHLIPAIVVVLVVAIAWRFELCGAAAFTGLGVLYAVMARGRIDWVVTVSGPLVALGVLFLVSWRYHTEARLE
jgi:hypothetical protein